MDRGGFLFKDKYVRDVSRVYLAGNVVCGREELRKDNRREGCLGRKIDSRVPTRKHGLPQDSLCGDHNGDIPVKR